MSRSNYSLTQSRIIVLMHYMELGGAEMALLGLLYALDKAKVVVDVFIYDHRGQLMDYIPESVNLLPLDKSYSMIERPIKEAIIKAPNVAIARMLAKFDHRVYRKKKPNIKNDESIFSFVANRVERVLPKINPDIEYDLCISFLTPHNYGLTKVNAKRRIAWIHTDYSTVSLNAEQDLKIWGAYDYIASISPEVTNSFLKTFPSLESKIVEIENILPKEYILKKSEEITEDIKLPGSPVLLSIGRYTTAKNYDNVPDIARRMAEAGLKDLRWYIIGYGGDEALIRSKIKEAGMEQHVIMLGKKENPYPYIKACDIYVQPSRFEGKSITVREAQILGKPVAITAYATAPSQINDGIDGVIVPLDNEGCAEGLCDFIANTSLQEDIKEYLSKHDFSGQSEVEKIYSLLGMEGMGNRE